MNDASGKSQQLALRTLTTDESLQRPKRLGNESYNSPEPLEPPDRRQDDSPSVKLEGERNAAARCDVELTTGETDTLGASGRVEDVGNKLKKLVNASDREHERSKRKDKQNSPGRAQVELDGPGDEAGASRESDCDQDPRNMPKKLSNMSELECKR